MANLAKYIVQLEAQTARYRRDLDRANRKLNRFHRNQKSKLAGLSKAWRLLAPAVVGVKFTLVARQALDNADALAKLTDRLGGTTEAFSELQFVAERSGLQFRTLTMGLQRMQRRVAEAAVDLGEARGALRELGLDARAITRLPIDQQFELIADAIAQVESDATKTRLAMKLFDSEGVALLQTMKNGAAGIRELRTQARALGISLSSEQAQAAVEAKDAITNLNTAWDAFAQTLATRAAPWLTEVADGLRRLTGGFTAQEEVELLQAQLDNLRASGLTLDDAAVRNTIDALNAALEKLQASDDRAFADSLLIPERTLDSLDDTRQKLFGVADAWAEVNAAIDNFEMPLTADDARRTFEQASDSLDEYHEALERIAKAQRETLADQARETFESASDELDDYIRSMGEAERQARTLGLTFVSAFEDAAIAGEELSEVIKSLGRDIARVLLRSAVTEPITGFFRGLFGARAEGGSVMAGGTYLVGERGPELFTPRSSGSIIPNHELGGGPSISYHIDARGVDEQRIMLRLAPLLERTVQVTKNEIRQEKEQGRFP